MELGNPTGLLADTLASRLRSPNASLLPFADCLFMEASLVAADRLYTTKRDIVESVGLGRLHGLWWMHVVDRMRPPQPDFHLHTGVKAEFPVFEDRIATQHLVYLRLARLQDPAQLARVCVHHALSFGRDVIIYSWLFH